MDTEGVPQPYYGSIYGLDGIERTGVVKRCGKWAPRYIPESRQVREPGSLAAFLEFYRVIMYELNRKERRTWLTLLHGNTIDAVAQADGVTRQAIYSRIRGKKGRGGMIRKNLFVCAWWLSGKHKINQHV